MAQRRTGNTLFEQMMTSNDPRAFGAASGASAPVEGRGATYNQQWNASKLSALQTLQQALDSVRGFGKSMFEDVESSRVAAQGRNQSNAVSRGLANTTILDSMRRGTESDAQRSRTQVGDVVTGRENDIRNSIAQVLLAQRPSQGQSAWQQRNPVDNSSPWGAILGGLGGSIGKGVGGGIGGLLSGGLGNLFGGNGSGSQSQSGGTTIWNQRLPRFGG